jgi:hypothetical protein
MNLRNRILALAGTWKLGAQFAPVLKMLAADRQGAVQSAAGDLRGATPEKMADRIARFRERERRRIGQLGRARYGAGWSRLDPRAQSLLMKRR